MTPTTGGTQEPSAPDATGNTPPAPSGHSARIGLYVVVTAISAACGLVVEIVAGRIIAPYLGMSLYTWTAVIAVVLAGFSLGNWIGGRLAELPPARAAAATAWSFALAALTALAILPLLRLLVGPILALDLPAVPTILILTTTLFFAPSVFVGIPSPVLTKLAIDEERYHLGRLIGLFYATGAVGSIAGTLAAGYLFISWLGSTATILTTAVVYAILAAVVAWDARIRSHAKPSSVRSTALKSGAAAGALAITLAAGYDLQAFTPNCGTESNYYCIRVVDADETFGTTARVLVLDHLGHGINLRDHPATLVSAYVELQDRLVAEHLGSRDAAFSAFFIGGGAFTLPRAWLARFPNARLVVAEIDPAVTEVAHESFWLPTDPRLDIRPKDARRALLADEADKHFDVIVGDAFHDIAVPPHLVTSEFYGLVRERLTANGLYVMNVVDDPQHPRLVLSVAATLRSAFPVVEIWVSNEAQTRATFVIRAGNQPTGHEVIGSRLQPGVAWQKLSDHEEKRLAAELSPIVLTDDFAPVDRIIGIE